MLRRNQNQTRIRIRTERNPHQNQVVDPIGKPAVHIYNHQTVEQLVLVLRNCLC